jgi:hypothetical protein
VTYVSRRCRHGKSKDWPAKFIGGLWEHLKRLRQFRNDIYHQDNEGTIARYKLEALEREMEKPRTHHSELLPRLWVFQKQHFDRRQRIADLPYESKKCWATLSKLYLGDAETDRPGNHSDIKQNVGWRKGVG